MDLIHDDQDEMRKSMQKTKWDRKKKKFVSVQSTMEKTKKFKTESGNYINASYKSNLYSKWLKNSKAGERDQDDDEDKDDKKNKKFFGSEKKYFGSHKFKTTGKPGVKRFKSNTNKENDDRKGGRRERRSGPNQETGGKRKFSDADKGPSKRFKSSDESSFRPNNRGNKRFSAGLKNKDQIVKERARKERVQKFQNRKKAGGGGGGGKGKSGGGGGKKSSFRGKK